MKMEPENVRFPPEVGIEDQKRDCAGFELRNWYRYGEAG